MGYFTEGTFHYLGYGVVAVSLAFLAYGFYHHKKSMRIVEKASLGIIKLNEGD